MDRSMQRGMSSLRASVRRGRSPSGKVDGVVEESGGAGRKAPGALAMLKNKAKSVRMQIRAAKNISNFKNTDSAKLKAQQRRARRGSIDCGPEDWPTNEDMSNWAPPIHQRVDYQDLVEEIRQLQICIPCEKLPPELQEKEEDEAGANSKKKKTTTSSGSGEAESDIERSEGLESTTTTSKPSPSGRARRVSISEPSTAGGTSSAGRKGFLDHGNPRDPLTLKMLGTDSSNPPHLSPGRPRPSDKYNFFKQHVRIPTREELGELPQELASHVQEAGRQTLMRLFVPILCMRQRNMYRKKLMSEREAVAQPVPVDFLATQCPIFKAWPTEFLPQVVAAMEYRCYETREIVVYEKEPASAMIFLVGGQVQEVKRRNTYPKETSKPISSTKCFGEMHLLTDEPWQSDIKVFSQRADIWVLTKPKFQKLLKLVPQHVMASIIRTAFERRNNTMRSKLPMTPEMLRSNTLFSGCSVDFVRDLIERLEPHAVPKDYKICEEGDPCDSIFFIVHGTVGQFKNNTATSSSSGGGVGTAGSNAKKDSSGGTSVMASQDSSAGSRSMTPQTTSLSNPLSSTRSNTIGDEVGGSSNSSSPSQHHHIALVTSGGVIAASAMAHGASYDGSYKTLTDTDMYVLSKNQFHALTRNYPTDLDFMLEAARSQRHEDIASNMNKYIDVVQSIPLLNLVLKRYYVKDFVPLLQPKSYRPLSSVCSSSSFCDRIIIVTKGKLRLGDGTEIGEGDCIGWTSCVPHRWGQGAITMNTTAEALEVPCQDLMDFLHSKNLLNKMVAKTKMLLFPNAYPKPEVDALSQSIGPHVKFYPVSPSRVVNHNEQGFCTVHMHLLEEHQREEYLKQQKIAASTPPPYRQLSSGVWVPKSKSVRGFSTRK